MLKIDFENKILALFDVFFWPLNKSSEKINTFFLINAIIASIYSISIWNVFIKFRWDDEKLTDISIYHCDITLINVENWIADL